MTKKKMIVICSSAAFYEHVNQIAEELTKLGFNVDVPNTAIRMKEENNYDVKRIKTWYENSDDFRKKVDLAKGHMAKVASSDAILIVNDDKPNQPNYIGPNGLMEWGLAYYLGKPVFILNGVNKDANTYEEVYGLSTAVLDGDLSKIKL